MSAIAAAPPAPKSKMNTKKLKSKKSGAAGTEVTIDRRRGERRGAEPVAKSTPKPTRRRHIDPTTCERDYSDQEVEFMRAIDDYKRRAGRMFPTCSEVLEVVRDLGYVQLNEDQAELLGFVDTEGDDEDFDPNETLDEFEG